MKELDVLLERFWVTKHEDKELYFQLKDASPKFKNFIEEKLGYKLIINSYMIRLEKLPGEPEPWMGIDGFENKEEYAYLCILLAFLEDKGAGEQFVLSEISEYIESNFPGEEKCDWTLFRHRKYLVRVLKFAVGLGMMRVDDGYEGDFLDSEDSEVLYQSTGVSRYFVRNFTGNIINYESAKDIQDGEWFDMDKDKGRIRRNRVYRRVFMSPGVYSKGSDDPDYMYIKNVKSMIQKDVEEILDGRFYVHKNGAFVFLDKTNNKFKDVFPNNKSISDIVIQLCGILGNKVRQGEIKKGIDDIATLSRASFEKNMIECRDFFYSGWSKEYRQMPVHKLCNEVIEYMKLFMMIEEEVQKREIKIMPIVGKYRGNYPNDYIAKVDKIDEIEIEEKERTK